MTYAFLALAFLACAAAAYVFVRMRRRRLSAAQRRRILRLWERVDALQDPARRVLEADSVLDCALAAAGFRGPLGEKLRSAGPRFTDENSVWAAHKLRNRIAHEPGLHVSAPEAARAVAALRRAVEDLF